MSCHSETGRVGIRRCIEINQRLHFRFTLPYQNRYFDTRPSPVGEVIRLPDLSCVETRPVAALQAFTERSSNEVRTFCQSVAF